MREKKVVHSQLVTGKMKLMEILSIVFGIILTVWAIVMFIRAFIADEETNWPLDEEYYDFMDAYDESRVIMGPGV